MTYEVLTSISVLDIPDSAHYDDDVKKLVNEQDLILADMGYSFLEDYAIDLAGIERVDDIYTAIERLDLKEGADLVRFDDGKIGYVGYYGCRPTERNYFKIIGIAEEME